MRKLILISAFVLASASAQASDIGSLIPAASDTPSEATPTPADAAGPAASSKQASARSRRNMASPGDTGFHRRVCGVVVGALLAEPSSRRRHDQTRGLQDEDEGP